MIPLPRWVWIALASLGGLVLVLGAIALIVSLPVLTRIAGSQRSLNRVNDIDRQTVAINRSLQQLGSLDSLSRNVSSIPKSLHGVKGSLGTVDTSIGSTVTELDTLRRELQPLEGQAPVLTVIARQLGEVEGRLSVLSALGSVPGQLGRLNTELGVGLTAIRRNTSGIDTLPAELKSLIASLRQVERHVRNLDEKTGPVILKH